jgi:hypothetical protein
MAARRASSTLRTTSGALVSMRFVVTIASLRGSRRPISKRRRLSSTIYGGPDTRLIKAVV